MKSTKITRLEREVKNFARTQDSKVRGGRLSAQDAALFVQSYGQGMIETAMRSLSLDEPPASLVDIVRTETLRLDANAATMQRNTGRRRRSA